MAKEDKNSEIRYMTIAKAFGIIAVVLGHSGSPLTDFVYQWHLALFYFISGYFYKDSYSQNPILFVKKRLKSLYLPYVIYGILFLLIHNLFFHINIYSNDPLLINNVNYLYSGGELLKNLFNTITLNTREQLLGIFWFVTVLIIVNILFCVVNVFIEKVFHEKKSGTKEKVRFFVIFTFFISGNLLAYNSMKLPRYLDISFVMIAIYYLGYIYKKNESHCPMSLYYAILAFSLLLVNSLYGDIRIDIHQYVNPSYFLSNSLLGIYVIIFCSKYLAVKLKRGSILDYIGQHTFTIMALHFLSFKVISYLQIVIYNLPHYKLAMFPTIKGNGDQWWIAYLFCGVFLPLGLKAIKDKLKNNIYPKKSIIIN